MDKNQAIESIKNLNTEASQLYPSALITMFEIDIGNILFGRGVASQSELDSQNNTVFRFHNSLKSSTNSIVWQGKTFIAAPIQCEGFETSVKGVLPTPKLSLTTSDDGIPFLSRLKDRIFQLGGDLVGSSVQRIRTFAKFLDAVNFYDSVVPAGFSPDPFSEFARDKFFIDRKSGENKNSLSFDLVSPLDLENIRLPGRLVIEGTCPIAYRGGECGYEYASRRNSVEHDPDLTLPQFAPAISNEKDELISDLLPGIPIIDKGQFQSDIVYNKGDQVFIKHNTLLYYFVCKVNGSSVAPPNQTQWISDLCSKKIIGCDTRWGILGSAEGGGIIKGQLKFSGYPSVTRFK